MGRVANRKRVQTERHRERWNTGAFRVKDKHSEMEHPETYNGHLSDNLVMEDMECDLAIFCN